MIFVYLLIIGVCVGVIDSIGGLPVILPTLILGITCVKMGAKSTEREQS